MIYKRDFSLGVNTKRGEKATPLSLLFGYAKVETPMADAVERRVKFV